MNKFGVKIVASGKDYLKWQFRPTFNNNGLIIIQKDKHRIKLTKPTQARILELTKVSMFDFHYHFSKNK